MHADTYFIHTSNKKQSAYHQKGMLVNRLRLLRIYWSYAHLISPAECIYTIADNRGWQLKMQLHKVALVWYTTPISLKSRIREGKRERTWEEDWKKDGEKRGKTKQMSVCLLHGCQSWCRRVWSRWTYHFSVFTLPAKRPSISIISDGMIYGLHTHSVATKFKRVCAQPGKYYHTLVLCLYKHTNTHTHRKFARKNEISTII